jgi:hypothetical protein
MRALRYIGLWAGPIFALDIAFSCGLVVGLAVAANPTP